MKNLVKTIIMSIAVVAAVAFSTISTEAKTVDASKADYGWYNDCESFPKKISAKNAMKFELGLEGCDLYYELKQGTTKVSSVKNPTKKSKKIASGKHKTFIVTKDSVIKIKIVDKDTSVKPDKNIYYKVIKVKKSTDYLTKAPQTSLDKGQAITFSCNKEVADKVIVYFDGKKVFNKENEWVSVGNTSKTNKKLMPTKEKTKVKMVFYKLNKKVGTKTYNVTLKTYTKPSKYKFYTVESNWVCEGCQKMAYFDNGSGAYVTQSGIVVPDGFKLVTKYNGKSNYNYKLNATNTFYYELYRARYYKVNGKYEFASWELMEKKTLTYKVWDGGSIGYQGFYDFVAPTANYTKGYEGMWVYCMKQDDNTVYRTFLKPGEALDPEYYWIHAELKINGEDAWTSAQEDYVFDRDVDGFCSYRAFKEACQGKHDFVNNPVVVEPTLAPTLAPVSPEVPQ